MSNTKKSRSDATNDIATLSLRTTCRVVLQSGRRRTLSGTRLLKVPLETTEADGQVIINSVSYWQEGVEPA